MTKQWAAELKVEPKQAEHLIESQFPNLSPVSLEFIGEGWDNTVYRVNHDYAFRFPRRQMGANLVEVEQKVLPALYHRLPLPIPKPLFFGKPATDYPWQFLGYNFLQGHSTCSAQLTMQQREKYAIPIAHFLKKLHAIDEQEAHKLGAKPGQLGKLDVPFRSEQAQQNIGKIKALKLFDHCDALFEILENLKDLRDTGKKTLVHGDFYARHLLLDESYQLSGVIDWGDVYIGNPAVDLQIVFSFLPQTAHQTFFNIYGPTNLQTRQLAFFRALCQSAMLVLYSHDVNDKNLLRESLFGLQLLQSAQSPF